MPIPSSAPCQSAIIQFSTLGDSYQYPVWVQSIRWILTTAATTTMALAITQSSSVAGSTYGWPVIGSSTVSFYPTDLAKSVEFPINALLYGVVVATLGNGVVQVIKGHSPHDASEIFST